MPQGGISGTAVAMATGGAFLAYIGLRNIPLGSGLRTMLHGQLPTPQAGGGSPAVAQAQAELAAGGSTLTPGTVGVASGLSGGTHPEIASDAAHYLGIPYVWGGADPSGFDCSGLVQWVLGHDLGVPNVPRTTYTQQPWRLLSPIPQSSIGAGDLVFWPGHVAIILNPSQVIHAPHPGATVRIENLASAGPTGTSPTFRRFIGQTNLTIAGVAH